MLTDRKPGPRVKTDGRVRGRLARFGVCGLRYLDPYGAEQAERWSAFRSRVDALGLDASSSDHVLEGARAMFEGVCVVFESLGSVWIDAGAASATVRRPLAGGSTVDQ